MTEIPLIDDLASPRSVRLLGDGLRDIGFVFIRSPRIAGGLPWVYGEFRKVFSLPEAVKRRYANPKIFYQRGWTPPFMEVGIACRGKGVGGADLPDAKECWFIGPDLPEGHPLTLRYPGIYPPNVWPRESPTFAGTMFWLYGALYDLGKEALQCLGAYLGRPAGYFEEMIRDSPTVMRAIHYPPMRTEDVGKIAWACVHTDINFLTVLPASTGPGLWIRRRDGEWIPGAAPAGYIIVQTADMLDYLTGGYLVSAAHEVRPPSEPTSEGRFSAALFIHARSDVLFEPVVAESERALYPPITAEKLLRERLRAIGLAE